MPEDVMQSQKIRNFFCMFVQSVFNRTHPPHWTSWNMTMKEPDPSLCPQEKSTSQFVIFFCFCFCFVIGIGCMPTCRNHGTSLPLLNSCDSSLWNAGVSLISTTKVALLEPQRLWGSSSNSQLLFALWKMLDVKHSLLSHFTVVFV